MKKYNFSSMLILVSVFVMAFFNACDDDEYIAEDIRKSIAEPEISEFSPSAGSAGTEIVVKGKHLATVSKAFIGGVETKVENRVSNNELLLRVIGNEISGPIRLVNNKGEAESQDEFSMAYLTPKINSITPEGNELEPRDLLTIKGTNLKTVLGFYFGDVKAEVKALSDTEATVVIPFVEADKAYIRLEHYGKGENVYVQSSVEYVMLKPVVEPVILSVPNEVEEGSTITITGEELDRISKVLFGEIELQIESTSFEELVVLFPKDLLTEDTIDELIVVHNTDRTLVINPEFKATIIPVYSYYFWKDLEISAQEGGSAFLSAKDGMVYDNCAAGNHIPDIDFSGYITNAKYFTFYGPHNTTNILKNYKCGDTGLDETMGAYLGTETRFRILNESDEAQNLLIQKVKNGEVDAVNDALFEGISDPAGSTAANKFDTADPGMVEGSVIYFMNKTKGKRGIMHVKTFKINFEELDKSSSVIVDILYEM